MWQVLDQRLLLKDGKKLQSAFDELLFQPCSHDTSSAQAEGNSR